MKIYYWNENCSAAGYLVPEDDIAEYEVGNHSAEECADWTLIFGTPLDLLEYAEKLQQENPSIYRLRLATAIRERVYFENQNLLEKNNE
jgi:hypothetical protein